MIRIDTNKNDVWDRIVNYYFDYVWPGGPSSIINWVEKQYNCQMDDNVALFNDPSAATLFQLRWQ